MMIPETSLVPVNEAPVAEQVSDSDAFVKLSDFKRTSSIEILPTQILKTEPLDRLFAEETEIYLPLLRGAELDVTVAAVEKVLSERMLATPHLAARSIGSRDQLDTWLQRLEDVGCNRLMLIAGDPLTRTGPYKDTLEILDTGLLEKHGFIHIGVAGHPDGHVHANSRQVLEALEIKKAYARAHDINMWVVTQFVFDIANFTAWLDEWDEALDFLPVHMGLAGPTSMTNLMRYAARCGVALSAKMILRNRNTMKLVGSWDPAEQLEELYRQCSLHIGRRLQALHLYPFGGLARSAHWLDSE